MALLEVTRPESSSAPSVATWTFGDDRRLVVHPDADSVFVEQYRRLGAALHHTQVQQGIRSVMITSALAAEGKTLSATNLALTLSRFGRRVLLIDGDLRRPSVHHLLQIENEIGLSDILRRSGGRLTAQPLSATLSVITGGHHDPDPMTGLMSEAVGHLLAEACVRFDWVVVDTPPAVLFPDAGLFAAKVDTCLLVVSSATTSGPVAAAAVEGIGRSRILGVVINRAEAAEVAYGYDYGAYRYQTSGALNGRFAWFRSIRP